MTSLITKEEYKEKLNKFIDSRNDKKLKSLKEMLNNDDYYNLDHPSSPGKPNFDNIRSTGEKAFQRAIFNNGYTLLDYGRGVGLEKVVWLDIETPVTLSKNRRRPCMDMLGSLEGVPVLCELKYYEKSRSNDPVYAIIELLIYRYFIQCNYKKLDKYNIHHHLVLEDFKWEVIVKNGFPQLLVVANEKYWSYWFNKIEKTELLNLTLGLGMDLDTNIHLFEAFNEDFIIQLGDRASYKPLLQNQTWKKIK